MSLSPPPPRRPPSVERNGRGGDLPPLPPRPRSRSGQRRGEADDIEEWKLKEDMEIGATRTLFIGNLVGNIRESDLRKVFDRYGRVEDIDIKYQHSDSGGPGIAYAFVMFQNMDMSQLAKYHMENQQILGQKCKIGYGKPTKSARLWVGGLGPWTSLESLEKEFDRYGAIEKIDYARGGNHAYVEFASTDAATDACKAMKGFPLGGRGRCIRVDFASPGGRKSESPPSSDDEPRSQSRADKHRRPPRPEAPRPPRKNRSRSPLDGVGQPPYKALRRGPHTPPSSPPPPRPESRSPPPPRKREVKPEKDVKPTEEPHHPPPIADKTTAPVGPPGQHLSAGSLTEIEQIRTACWTGALVLKKSAYPIRLYNLKGDDDLIDSLLRDAASGEALKLHVTQRLPFAQASQADFQRYLEMAPAGAAFLLAGPNPNATAADLRLANAPTRPLKAFVHYLSEKSAAGVVSVGSESGGGVLYAFPRCDLADSLLRQLAPNLSVMKNCADDCLLTVLVRGTGKVG